MFEQPWWNSHIDKDIAAVWPITWVFTVAYSQALMTYNASVNADILSLENSNQYLMPVFKSICTDTRFEI
ncbi:hypothetical protein [Allorhodopirellula heiligendammensis]|uniref:hypothetical protein n=1 Tax=Allorhodopirellula heiligendammensis TaxID=2714739 RepID=UPI0011B71522|nr:hypothetical protein [Allorhodopirellula heiligendammensis]